MVNKLRFHIPIYSAYCTWRDGSNLSPYQDGSNAVSNMNCRKKYKSFPPPTLRHIINTNVSLQTVREMWKYSPPRASNCHSRAPPMATTPCSKTSTENRFASTRTVSLSRRPSRNPFVKMTAISMSIICCRITMNMHLHKLAIGQGEGGRGMRGGDAMQP